MRIGLRMKGCIMTTKETPDIPSMDTNEFYDIIETIGEFKGAKFIFEILANTTLTPDMRATKLEEYWKSVCQRVTSAKMRMASGAKLDLFSAFVKPDLPQE